MTAIQLRAELFREMSPLLDSETAMMRLLTFVKGMVTTRQSGKALREGWSAAAKQAHAEGQDKLIVDDVFLDETMEDWKW